MLIYGGGDVSPFGAVQYKSRRIHSRKSIRLKSSKGGSGQRRRRRLRVRGRKKVKKTRKRVRKVKRRKAKKLSAKNVKFLKRLGLRVKKH